MGRKLYVGNLPYETNEQDLQELFTQAGNVETVTVMRVRIRRDVIGRRGAERHHQTERSAVWRTAPDRE